MIELCHLCRKQHETGGDFSFGGIPWKVCPELSENMMVPLRKVPFIIHGPNGEKFESYRVELAGAPTRLARNAT